jgi:hypothetical protein
MPSLTQQAHQHWQQHITPGDWCIDATLGNGHDTLALAHMVGSSGRLTGFDVQAQALCQTKMRLQTQARQGRVLPPVQLHCTCHSRMLECLPKDWLAKASTVVFNLGYLPGGADKSLTTQPQSTLLALAAGLKLLHPGGLLCVMCYPGHATGKLEADSVSAWLKQQQCSGHISLEVLEGTPSASASPILYLARRRH